MERQADPSTGPARPASRSQAASAGAAAAAAVAADKASKTKLLTDLAQEVSAIKKDLEGVSGAVEAERLWIKETLKPGLATMRTQLLADIDGVKALVATQQRMFQESSKDLDNFRLTIAAEATEHLRFREAIENKLVREIDLLSSSIETRLVKERQQTWAALDSVKRDAPTSATRTEDDLELMETRLQQFVKNELRDTVEELRQDMRFMEERLEQLAFREVMRLRAQLLTQDEEKDAVVSEDVAMTTKQKEVADWLDSVGLAVYTRNFFEKGFDSMFIVKHIIASELDALGIALPGHRKALVLALAELNGGRSIPADFFSVTPTATLAPAATTMPANSTTSQAATSYGSLASKSSNVTQAADASTGFAKPSALPTTLMNVSAATLTVGSSATVQPTSAVASNSSAPIPAPRPSSGTSTAQTAVDTAASIEAESRSAWVSRPPVVVTEKLLPLTPASTEPGVLGAIADRPKGAAASGSAAAAADDDDDTDDNDRGDGGDNIDHREGASVVSSDVHPAPFAEPVTSKPVQQTKPIAPPRPSRPSTEARTRTESQSSAEVVVDQRARRNTSESDSSDVVEQNSSQPPVVPKSTRHFAGSRAVLPDISGAVSLRKAQDRGSNVRRSVAVENVVQAQPPADTAWVADDNTTASWPLPGTKEARTQDEAEQGSSATSGTDEVQLLLTQMKRLARSGVNGKPVLTFETLARDPMVERRFAAIGGTLKLAKQQGLVSYAGDLLLEGKHETVEITIVSSEPVDKPVVASGPPKVSPKPNANSSAGAPGAKTAVRARQSLEQEAMEDSTMASAALSSESALSDSASLALQTVNRIFTGDPSIDWALFKYKPDLMVQATGSGGTENMADELNDGDVLYGYLRTTIGAEQRTKFVFIRWVGDSITPMQRAKAVENKNRILAEAIKFYHVEVMAHQVEELDMPVLMDRLKKAGGANYDPRQNDALVQPTDAFASMKESAAKRFGEIEKQGNVKANPKLPTVWVVVSNATAVYATGPLSTTPMDLSVRATTVGATSFRSNVKDLKF